jgi:hypothetical protein
MSKIIMKKCKEQLSKTMGDMLDEWVFVLDVEHNFWQWRSDISISVHDKNEGEAPDVAVIVFGRLLPFEAATLTRRIADHIEAHGFPDKAFESSPDMRLSET